jgi:hypothetical protein
VWLIIWHRYIHLISWFTALSRIITTANTYLNWSTRRDKRGRCSLEMHLLSFMPPYWPHVDLQLWRTCSTSTTTTTQYTCVQKDRNPFRGRWKIQQYFTFTQEYIPFNQVKYKQYCRRSRNKSWLTGKNLSQKKHCMANDLPSSWQNQRQLKNIDQVDVHFKHTIQEYNYTNIS